MQLQQLDSAIARLAAAVERVGANLVDVERDEHRQLLEAASLRGETAERWQRARASLAQLFDGYVRLTQLLEHAKGLRRTAAGNATGIAELEHALFGASVEMSSTPIAVSERGLLDGSTRIVWGTPDELIASMTRSFDLVQNAVVEICAEWEELVPRVSAARDGLALALTQANSLGDACSGELGQLTSSLDRFADTLAADPLAVERDDLGELERSIESISAEIDGASRLRVELSDRIGAARRLADALRHVEGAVDVRDRITYPRADQPEAAFLRPRYQHH